MSSTAASGTKRRRGSDAPAPKAVASAAKATAPAAAAVPAVPSDDTSGRKARKRARAAAAAEASPPATSDAAAASSAPATSTAHPADPTAALHRPRVLVFAARGLTARYRHFMDDLRHMIPHHKKDAKLDAKDSLSAVTEIAVVKSCNTVLYLDTRKKRDLYLWLSRAPAGPSVKFLAVNVHTMDELRMTGNCLRGSRPILSFDKAFNEDAGAPHLRIMRELLAHTFATPKGHPKSQPFHDHVLHFGYAAGRVWVRHYQILDKATDAAMAARMAAAGEEATSLVEIGPRFVLQPVRIFAGSMGGATLWANPEYVTPNQVRQNMLMAKARKYTQRQIDRTERRAREDGHALPVNPVDEVFKDGEDVEGGADEAEEGDEDEEMMDDDHAGEDDE